jgi:putative ABC transport system permease protein
MIDTRRPMAKEQNLTSHVALGETLAIALDTLRAHKLRSYLTLLGIVLAVTTLVSVMSVVHGLNLYVTDRVANLGANAFVVDRFGIITNAQALAKAQRRPLLRVDDYQALASQLQLSQNVAAIEGTTVDVRAGNALFQDARLSGVTPNYIDVRSMDVAAGRFLTEGDELHRQPVCFIGAALASRFFPTADPLGRSIRAGTQTYLVVGVAAAIGSVFGISQDNFVMIPFSTYEQAWHAPNGSITMFVQARDTELLEAAEDEARVVLRSRHHLAYSAPDDFGILGSASILSLWQKITGNVFALAVWLTAVFLVVGGIVIMNIMLASVTERTREIGIRKALGARRGHILAQFLVESALLSAIGGIVGVTLAVASVAVVRATTPMPVETPLSAVVTALAVSTAVGLFFGIFPALRASRLNPIEALRSET